MQPNNLQDGNTKVKFMLRILEKIHVGSLTGSGSERNRKVGSGYGSEKNHSGSTTLDESTLNKDRVRKQEKLLFTWTAFGCWWRPAGSCSSCRRPCSRWRG
jgi:hypothetical protein